MTCRQFADFMAEYLSGEMSDEVRAAFERHVFRCANCQRYLAHYRATIELGRRAFETDDAGVPPDVPEELIRAIVTTRPPG